ncbi:MAG: metallopeptidase family protein [Candidatus Saccharimonadales bacterium]
MTMMELTDQQFDQLITRAMDELPQAYITNLHNVAIVQQDTPTANQITKMKLDNHHVLLGLFEGVPLTQQGSGFSGMLPSKITLFKNSILAVVNSDAELFEQIKRTIWHEIAHYYGLNHSHMNALQQKK